MCQSGFTGLYKFRYNLSNYILIDISSKFTFKHTFQFPLLSTSKHLESISEIFKLLYGCKSYQIAQKVIVSMRVSIYGI